MPFSWEFSLALKPTPPVVCFCVCPSPSDSQGRVKRQRPWLAAAAPPRTSQPAAPRAKPLSPSTLPGLRGSVTATEERREHRASPLEASANGLEQEAVHQQVFLNWRYRKQSSSALRGIQAGWVLVPMPRRPFPGGLPMSPGAMSPGKVTQAAERAWGRICLSVAVPRGGWPSWGSQLSFMCYATN